MAKEEDSIGGGCGCGGGVNKLTPCGGHSDASSISLRLELLFPPGTAGGGTSCRGLRRGLVAGRRALCYISVSHLTIISSVSCWDHYVITDKVCFPARYCGIRVVVKSMYPNKAFDLIRVLQLSLKLPAYGK